MLIFYYQFLSPQLTLPDCLLFINYLLCVCQSDLFDFFNALFFYLMFLYVQVFALNTDELLSTHSSVQAQYRC